MKKNVFLKLGAVLTSLILCAALFGCSKIKGWLSPAKSDPILPHLIAESEKEAAPVRPSDSFPVNALTGETVSAQLKELPAILRSRFKPDLDGALPQVAAAYEGAKAVLNRYVKNDFSDLERIHAIHDWLTYYVKYDSELYERYLNGEDISGEDDAFNVIGVFVNKRAVCDGISKAFELMCLIEGIDSIRVEGEYDISPQETMAHAWNKVKLEGVWYNVDATMDFATINISGNEQLMIHHGFFLISDSAITQSVSGKHSFGTNAVNYDCPTDYDFHSKIDGITTSKTTYKMEVTSQNQLNDIFSYIKSKSRKIGKLELKLNFEGYDPQDLGNVNAYVPELKEAYGKVKDCGFAFVPEDGKYPYLRYPNGVFLLLIYG